MELTLINKLLISALIAAVIGIIVGLIVRRGNDGKVGCGCGIMFPCAILVFIILSFLTPEVIVISGAEGHLSHETKSTTKDIVVKAVNTMPITGCLSFSLRPVRDAEKPSV